MTVECHTPSLSPKNCDSPSPLMVRCYGRMLGGVTCGNMPSPLVVGREIHLRVCDREAICCVTRNLTATFDSGKTLLRAPVGGRVAMLDPGLDDLRCKAGQFVERAGGGRQIQAIAWICQGRVCSDRHELTGNLVIDADLPEQRQPLAVLHVGLRGDQVLARRDDALSRRGQPCDGAAPARRAHPLAVPPEPLHPLTIRGIV